MTIYGQFQAASCQGSIQGSMLCIPKSILNYMPMTPLVGLAEKGENYILKYADVDYHGNLNIKQGSIQRNKIFNFSWVFFLFKHL